MKFNPKSDEELVAMNLIQPGQYPFEVIEAQDAVSQNGNEMINLKLKVWDMNHRERLVYDRILEAWPLKLKHFCKATNMLHKYESGSLMDKDCIGKSGYVELAIEKQKDKNGNMVDRNVVKDYFSAGSENVKQSLKEKKESNDLIDDDIPF